MQASDKIRIVIAEDEQPIREGLKQQLERLDSDFSVVGLAQDGLQALELVNALAPQIVITDIKMPGMDGIELIRKLKLGHPAVHVVVLSGYSDFAYTQQAIRCGVFNYLLKPIQNETLLELLTELKREIRAEQHRRSRAVIYSSNYHTQRPHAVRYLPFALCIGNLCFDNTDATLATHYRNLLAGIPWQSFLDGRLPEAMDWYLSDEDEPNQKLVCFSVSSNAPSGTAVAQRLQQSLQQRLNGIPVTVCGCENPVPEQDVWLCAQRLRNILRQRTVPGHSRTGCGCSATSCA